MGPSTQITANRKKKRRLNEFELPLAEQMQTIGRSIRQIAKFFGVNRPSIVKSLRKEVK